jgi:acetoin utilization protein AcuB
LLGIAERVMRDHHIRHLPVLDGERVTGVLSQRDALMAESLPGVNPLEVRVEEVMAEEVFTASPDAPLAEVVTEMMKRKIGSAVIVEEGRCVGVFTTTDALTALAELLSEPI